MESEGKEPPSVAAAEAKAEAAGCGEFRKKMKVLAAVDESEGSLHALSWALDNLFPSSSGDSPAAASLGRLILLHAQQPLQHFMHPVGPSIYATSSVFESVRKAQEENSHHLLERAARLCSSKAPLVKTETVIAEGDPKETICQVAEQMDVDLLVVGSRGLSKIKRAILGSASDYCAHHAKCPVLIVKPPKGNN
ncbi:universal stress protein A-like protein [Zingiber officinale]|uniref:universal stress protein A-like protein n=1 Tax=Zingiber officinale TaxID=94328 RepID=UPI001C4BC872|nr:universal stress protein A-like protein [Zingiber officinale]